MAHPIWPLFDLEVATARLTLRYIDDDLGVRLAHLAAQGVHDPAFMPFWVEWTDVPSPQLERNALQFYWRTRAGHAVDDWNLSFAVIVDGEVVGSTSLLAAHFTTLRTFETGSWLGQRFQGQGIGREMREACLHLGFAGLEAERAVSAAYSDNGPSNGVSRRLGYSENGRGWSVRRGVPAEQVRYLLDRESWSARRRDDIEIRGLDACREFLVRPDA